MAGPVQAKKITPEKVEWLWEERIPRRMLTIIGGKADQGKGLFCSYLASYVSNQRFTQKNGRKRSGRVLLSAIEDSHALMTRPRLEASGANLNGVELWRFQLPAMFKELEAHLKAKQIDLLIIDPMASHLSNGISRHSDNVRKVTDPLAELVDSTGTSCVIVEHILKRVPQSGHPLAAIGGTSSGLIAAARMAYLFGTDPADADRRVLACVKHNIREKPKELAFELDVEQVDLVGDVPFLVLDQECEFDPMRMLQSNRDATRIGRPPDKRAMAAEWLTNYLYDRGKAMPAGKVFEDGKQMGLSSKTLRRACIDQEIIRKPPGGGRNCTWELPDALKLILDQANGVNVAPVGDVDPTAMPVSAAEVTEEELAVLLGGADA